MQNNNNFKVNPQYLAGFFDGEGSMFVQIRYRASFALKFCVTYYLTFHQNNFSFNKWLKSQLNEFGGTPTARALRVNQVNQVFALLDYFGPHLVIKTGQRDLMYEIRELHKVMKTPEDLLKIAQLADAISALNYHSTHVQGSYSLKVKEFHNI
jgi:hypothetical protein